MTQTRDDREGTYPAWWRDLTWSAWGLTLVPVRRDHAARVRRALTAEIAHWLAIGSVDDMRSGTSVWASESSDLARSGRAFRYLVVREGKFSGVIEVRPDAVRGHIGYWLRRGARGHGTMTLANALILLVAFDGLGLKAIDWVADAENTTSIAVMTRLGATLVDRYPARDGIREFEVRYRLARRKFAPYATGPARLRALLT